MENKPVGKLNGQGSHSKRAKKSANNNYYGDYGQVAAVNGANAPSIRTNMCAGLKYLGIVQDPKRNAEGSAPSNF
jgi:hypothetical protein